jgi:hypothetical protein
VAGAVAGEGAAGAVGSVGSGGETEDEDASERVAEAGDGAGPVGVVDVGSAADFADVGAVVAEARAEVAGADGLADADEVGCGRRGGTWAWESGQGDDKGGASCTKGYGGVDAARRY